MQTATKEKQIPSCQRWAPFLRGPDRVRSALRPLRALPARDGGAERFFLPALDTSGVIPFQLFLKKISKHMLTTFKYTTSSTNNPCIDKIGWNQERS